MIVTGVSPLCAFFPVAFFDGKERVCLNCDTLIGALMWAGTDCGEKSELWLLDYSVQRCDGVVINSGALRWFRRVRDFLTLRDHPRFSRDALVWMAAWRRLMPNSCIYSFSISDRFMTLKPV